MNETIQDDRLSVYEIGYLVAGVPEERVVGEGESVRAVINKAGATIISEDAPRREQLAYTMRKKTVAGSYDKYDEAYFGWIKFELSPDKIEAVKKEVEVLPSILRMLLTSTVRENTYLGKHAPVAPVPFGKKQAYAGVGAESSVVGVDLPDSAPAAGIPATVEDMDKSIDDMVKEA